MSAVSDTTPKWPDVVFRGDALVSAGITGDAVSVLVRELVERLFDEQLPIVQKLVVADLDVYGDAIREHLAIDLHQTHTEREQYRGIAKTLPTYHECGRVDHTVIVCAGVISAVLGNGDTIEPTMPAAFGQYVLQHEFAHCYDHLARKQGDPVGLTDCGEFSIRRVGVYYKHILLAELAACLFAGRTLDDETFQMLMQLDAEPLEQEIQNILDMRHRFRTWQTQDLNGLAFESSQCIWLVLVQFAKIFGHMIGAGRASAPIGFPQTVEENAEAKEAIEGLAAFLGQNALSYPGWPPDGWGELDQTWHALSEALGFRFEVTDDGDALWLDDSAD